MYQTPVRHDQLSVTKVSLRSQAVIPGKESLLTQDGCINVDFNEDTANTSMDVDHQRESLLLSDMVMSASPSEISSNSVDDDNTASVILLQKQSTPRPLTFPTRAVSSTPNQELLASSKLIRHVSTQTNLTLNARSSNKLDEELMSFSTVETDEEGRSCMNCTPQQNFSINMDITSPLRDVTSSKLVNCEKTPCHGKGRKLSLRSKTMICSAMEKTKNNPRIWTRHKSVEEKRIFYNTFSLLPHPKTPPSCSDKAVHNPFEVDLPQRLGKSLVSPDVFDCVVSPSEDSEYIRWTIEDISSINPVPIDEDFTFTSDEEDPDKECIVQQQIERYFSETHNILSPYDLPKACSVNKVEKHKFHAAVASTPQKDNCSVVKQPKHVGTQTALTLPDSLSENLEESLKSYFKLYDTDYFNLSASNLRRKLFFHSEDEPPSPVRFEDFVSPASEKLDSTSKNIRERFFSPITNQQELSSPEMSPVIAASTGSMSRNNSLTSCKKRLHHYFSGKEAEEEKDLTNETSDEASSTPPSSQDTGYHTEESWKQTTHPSLKTLTP